MSEFCDFNDELDAMLAADPALRQRVEQCLAEMHEADALYAVRAQIARTIRHYAAGYREVAMIEPSAYGGGDPELAEAIEQLMVEQWDQ